ncbi:hypothetical protein NP493_3131g00000 [Ridgeia piscesae]|uniref:Reverse transcriptase n=1 Tax=Ridgeia piscesae TaxID=27915 RepID=A0AAD9JAP6_RIDPI|nr:hypothetical protein NP493_3131g00000 [Ridgeia piscesae]
MRVVPKEGTREDYATPLGNQGTREDYATPLGNQGTREDYATPLGNQGTREDYATPLGNQGTREDYATPLGNQGTREDYATHFGNLVYRDYGDGVLKAHYLDNLNEIPTIDEMARAIAGLKYGIAPGGDGIPAEIWKHGGDNLLSRLYQLITNAWDVGSVPQVWKNASIVTIYKKGKGLTDRTAPLRELTRKDSELTWNESHTKAVRAIHVKLSNAPVLRYYKTKGVTIQADESRTGLGDALMQD